MNRILAVVCCCCVLLGTASGARASRRYIDATRGNELADVIAVVMVEDVWDRRIKPDRRERIHRIWRLRILECWKGDLKKRRRTFPRGPVRLQHGGRAVRRHETDASLSPSRRSSGMPVRVLVTAGSVADISVAPALIAGLEAEALLTDKGYDSQAFVEAVEATGTETVIPPRKNRKEPRAYDKHLYKLRHLVENAILAMKEWRGVATRYARRASSFLAIAQIRCLFRWLRIL